MRPLALSFTVFAALVTGASAQNLAGVELRGGPAFRGLELGDNMVDPFQTGRLEDLEVELIYKPPVDLSLIGSPGLAVGGTFNFRGYENLVHANLNWHVPVFTLPIYLEAGLGGAYVTGYLHAAPPGYRNLGCHTMLYFQIGAGVELPDNWTATLAGEHASTDWMCGADNDGFNSVALTLGRRF